MLKTIVCCFGVLFSAIHFNSLASPLGEGAFDTISIKADEAFEDILPDILHLHGHFSMHSDQWQLASERATVYGQPDKPNKIILEGSPATFQIKQSETGPVEASAPRMAYERDTDTLELSGGAILKLEKETIRGTVIKFDISSNGYHAGGAGGVRIVVPASN